MAPVAMDDTENEWTEEVNDTDSNFSEEQDEGEIVYDQASICSNELEVAANETVNTSNLSPEKSDNVDDRLRRLEEKLKHVSEKRLSGPDSTLESTRDSVDPPSAPHQTERGSNIRWDLIPKFPKDIPSNMLWENWQSFIKNFEIAVSLSTFSGSSDRAKLLYLSIGKDLQDIIGAANIQPNYQDPRCYPTLVDEMNRYFKSMTDTGAEHEAFQAMRQNKGESIVTFHARLTQKVRLCGYSLADQNRFVLAQLLKGMLNRKIAVAARTYGYDADYVVQAATRVESYKTDEEVTEPHVSDVLAIDRKRTFNKGSSFQHKSKKIEEFRGTEAKIPKRFSSVHREGRRFRCWRCGFTFHNRDKCPALEKRCNSCGREGHYAKMCRNDSRKSRVNQVQEDEARKDMPYEWKKDPNDDQV